MSVFTHGESVWRKGYHADHLHGSVSRGLIKTYMTLPTKILVSHDDDAGLTGWPRCGRLGGGLNGTQEDHGEENAHFSLERVAEFG